MKKLLLVFAVLGIIWAIGYTSTPVITRAELEPVSAKCKRSKAVKSHQTHENAPESFLTANTDVSLYDILNGYKAEFERSIDDRGRDQRGIEDAGTDDPGQHGDARVKVSPGNLKRAGYYESELIDDEPAVESPEMIYLGEWTVTFYCPCVQCCGKWAGMNSTASGNPPSAGWTVAAGPSYPFGSILYIEGFGEYCVQDRGVPDGWVDIYVNDHSEIPGYGMTTAAAYLIY